jgi:hypothetical protein
VESTQGLASGLVSEPDASKKQIAARLALSAEHTQEGLAKSRVPELARRFNRCAACMGFALYVTAR